MSFYPFWGTSIYGNLHIFCVPSRGIALLLPGIPSPARSQRERLADQLDIAVPGGIKFFLGDQNPSKPMANMGKL